MVKPNPRRAHFGQNLWVQDEDGFHRIPYGNVHLGVGQLRRWKRGSGSWDPIHDHPVSILIDPHRWAGHCAACREMIRVANLPDEDWLDDDTMPASETLRRFQQLNPEPTEGPGH